MTCPATVDGDDRAVAGVPASVIETALLHQLMEPRLQGCRLVTGLAVTPWLDGLLLGAASGALAVPVH